MSVTQDKNLAPFAPGPEGNWGGSLQRGCTHTLFCFPTPLVASSSSTLHVLLLMYKRRHHNNLTFAFKRELSCEHLWAWSERRRASKSGSCRGKSERSPVVRRNGIHRRTTKSCHNQPWNSTERLKNVVIMMVTGVATQTFHFQR